MNATQSVNTRHIQKSGASVFVTKTKQRDGTVEVVCSSARRRMDHAASHTCYRLFSHTLTLDPTQITTWPEHTDVRCWNCCHTFDTVPICIPKSKLNTDTKLYYEVYGVFCSINCAKKMVLGTPSHDQPELLMQLNELCVNVYGLSPDDVFNAKPSPPRMFLTMFGGHMSIEQYRETSLSARTVLVSPPFVSHAMVMETHSGIRGGARAAAGGEHTITHHDDADVVVEPLREGQHVLRGLRRPTLPSAPPTGGVGAANKPSTMSRFDDFVSRRTQDAAPPLASGDAARPTKRPRVNKVIAGGGKKGASPWGAEGVQKGGLNSFLKSSRTGESQK